MVVAATRLEDYRAAVLAESSSSSDSDSSNYDSGKKQGTRSSSSFSFSSSFPSPPPPPRLNVGVVGGSVASGVGGRAGKWRFPAVVAATLQKVFPRAAVTLVADGSRAGAGSLTAGLCLDSLVGPPSDESPSWRWQEASSSASSSSDAVHAANGDSGGGGGGGGDEDDFGDSADASGSGSMGHRQRNGGNVGLRYGESRRAAQEVDLLLLEFATDDRALYGSDGLPFELLLRAALSRRPLRPAVVNVMAFGPRLSWASAQDPAQVKLCRHYGVSAVSLRDALLPIVRKGGASSPAARAAAAAAPLTAADLSIAGSGDEEEEEGPRTERGGTTRRRLLSGAHSRDEKAWKSSSVEDGSKGSSASMWKKKSGGGSSSDGRINKKKKKKKKWESSSSSSSSSSATSSSPSTSAGEFQRYPSAADLCGEMFTTSADDHQLSSSAAASWASGLGALDFGSGKGGDGDDQDRRRGQIAAVH